ncbi:TIGR02611 family protein [Labedella phragmitis]|uniref:TIGR02611 family protein n=1 Tax=Labedella phragmitis TaxID=2498849 RepID=A0A3S4A7D9_9MICO|nr:TIGR02611 family protein [Labedella phragmitis]RWZ53160.1 TIGR02611 family protein [Labedella phragmitis]
MASRTNPPDRTAAPDSRDSSDGTAAEVAVGIAAGEDPRHPVRRVLGRLRSWIHGRPRLRVLYRSIVALLGAALTLVGLALVPLPGPGWLVVFLGLAVLGTEFAWARRLAAVIKRMLARFWTWWRNRRRSGATTVR